MKRKTILIMAGGTGGHIFPALAIADLLQEKNYHVEWLGTPNGLETELLKGTEIPINLISARGLRGKRLSSVALAPFMLLRSVTQAMRVVKRVKPCCVLGMGGYVTGPGGIAAWLSGRKLLIHEQNSVAGLTNRYLARIATRVMESFPGTFAASEKVMCTGNPVRKAIQQLSASSGSGRISSENGRLRLLVLGGSQGAAAINTIVPQSLAQFEAAERPEVWHQTGRDKIDETLNSYQRAGLEISDKCRVAPFIEDMAAAYRWADVVVGRAGATTVSEIAASGVASVLVPFPYAVDDHQTGNARWLSDAGAAVLVPQQEFSVVRLTDLLQNFTGNTTMLQKMAEAARSLALPEAGERVATACMEVCNEQK